jgi:transposase
VSSKAQGGDVAVDQPESKQNKSNLMRTLIHALSSSSAAAEVILGLDVAKDKVQAELQLLSGSKLCFAFANNDGGFKKLERFLEQHSVLRVHAGLEATGPYSEPLAYWLHAHGHRLSLLNPRRVKDYARSAGLRNKTDALDAGIIADSVRAQRERLPLWQPPTAPVRQLQELVRRRHQVEGLLLGERNRLEGEPGVRVRSSIERLIQVLRAEKASLEKAMTAQIRSHPELWRDHQLLCTITSIGALTATVILAEMATPGQVQRARQAAARAGLCPRREQSGTSVRRNKGIGKEGSRYLRKALYMPALVAIKHNAPLRHFAQRLQAAGKSDMAIIGAVMRKLVHISFGVLKHQQPFNPSLA